MSTSKYLQYYTLNDIGIRIRKSKMTALENR